jgi:N-terminal domain on NACHT_NTPase and P-loop NTPases
MSGAEVIGLISSVIAIIGAAKTVYDAAADAKGQPEAFSQVAARLPLVIGLLDSAKGGVPKLNTTEQEALEAILQSCEDKAESLGKLFRRVVRKDDDKWYERYEKAVVAVSNGKKLESLMGEILKDVQVIVCDKLKEIATSNQVKELGEAIKDMKELPSSLAEETGSINQKHSGTGDNIAHKGAGSIYAGKAHHNQPTGNVVYGGEN